MNNNIFVATLLSLAILLGFQYFYAKPHQDAARAQYLTQQMAKTAAAAAPAPAVELHDRADILKETSRVAIATPELAGSINLKGARLDDLTLVRYRENEDADAPQVILFSPAGSALPHMAYYTEFSWLAEGQGMAVPGEDTQWTPADKQPLTPDHPVRLTWDNKQGLNFERTIAVDTEAMFTITDRVSNSGAAPVTLYPFGRVARQGVPSVIGRSSVHEGGLGVLDGTLKDFTYKSMIGDGKDVLASTGGWLGMTDKYWLTAMIPPQDKKLTAEFVYNRADAADPTLGYFQSDFRSAPVTIAAGGSTEQVSHLFAGAKQIKLLDRYGAQYDVPHFDKAIDFGRFYFLSRPFLYTMDWLEHQSGSMAAAILLFTILLKIVTTPMTLKSYHSMAKMKLIQPELKKLQERYPDDKMRLQQEMMELYKREKINPVSGCVPQLITLPVLFALYNVLSVDIDLRQAPFYGWIHDMSLPDPTSWVNLFGLAPWGIPEQYSLDLHFFTLYFPPAIHVGLWPVLMGFSIFLQQKIMPTTTTDKSQARMFMLMPFFITYIMALLPAGLVIYYTWSNLLGSAQQWFITREDARRKKGIS